MAPADDGAGTSAAHVHAHAARGQQHHGQGQHNRKAKREVNQFVHPPEKHISVDSHELKAAIRSRLELTDREPFDDLVKLMEGVANFDFYDLKQRMRNNFLPFSSGARNTIYLRRSSKNLPTTPMLDSKEEEFIADVYEVLRASHYTLLTTEEWELATSENFNLNLPMEVKWDYMDGQLLPKFWASSRQRTAMRKRLPDCMADRILVFHRGIGTERLSGLLIDQKLDLLMDYTIFHALDRARDKLASLLERVAAAKGGGKSGGASGSGGGGPPRLGAGPPALGRSMRATTMKLTEDAAMGCYEFEGDAMIGSRHRFAKRVERMTLARQCPTLVTLLKAFPRSMSLQEPTFKDLVVVYRRALPARVPPTASASAPNKTKEERLQGILAHRNINIKVFGETPMADVEMIFPDKKVSIKPFQLVNLAVTVATALFAGALVLWKAGGEINMNILWTAASLVATRCFTVYTTAQTQRTMATQQMTASLYDKMQDSQEGVISVITEELSDQQLKQMLLAYMMLLLKERPMSHQDLDDTCEDFLMKEFDHPIDYDLDAALPRLESWGLVRRLPTNQKLEAVPMAEAISMLEDAWSTAYKEIGKDGEDKVPTIDMITGHFSVFREGIEASNRRRRDAAADQEASRKGGIMGKAGGAFGKATRGALGGLSILPGGGASSSGKSGGGAGASPAELRSGSASAGGAAAADDGSTAASASDLASPGSAAGDDGSERKSKGGSSLKSMFRKLKA